MKNEAKEIIIESLTLPSQNLPILEMLDKQEKLIERFIKLGYTKDRFFTESRKRVGIDDSPVISSNYLERALNIVRG